MTNQTKFDFSDTDTYISIKDIRARVSDNEIYEFYIGEAISFSRKYKAPYREDNNPSISFFRSSSGLILWKDWGDGLTSSAQDSIAFVMRHKGCSFQDALIEIDEAMKLGILSGKQEIIYQPELRKNMGIEKEIKEKKLNRIEIKYQPFKAEDRVYWGNYHLDLSTLTKYGVFSIEYAWFNDMLVRNYSRSNPVFAYVFDDKLVGRTYKLYSPLASNGYKWLNNSPNNIVQGCAQLDYFNDFVIVTKSLKDVMVLHKMGISAVAPHSEVVELPEKITGDISRRFKGNVIIFYDNDEVGNHNSNLASKRYNYKKISIPEKLDCKDISDYVKENGLKAGQELMKYLIKNAKVYSDI